MTDCGSVLLLALPPATSNGHVFFAKSSNRPSSEIHEVIYMCASNHEPGAKLMPTYAEIEEIRETCAVILSKPHWSWGAEMGANENGVCIGCSFQPRLEGDMLESDKGKLLSTDLVRLGLERSTCSHEALDVIVTLLEKHGLAANNSESIVDGGDRFVTSFLISDRHDAWVLEVVTGKQWAAEHVTRIRILSHGVRWIADFPTIKTKIDLASKDCHSYAVQHNWWSDEQGEFDFAMAYSTSAAREAKESFVLHYDNLAHDLLKRGNICSKDVLEAIRKIEVDGPCSSPEKYIPVSSQMSVLPACSDSPCCHWFTATPFPSKSLFKPFIFCENASVGNEVTFATHLDHSAAKSIGEHALYTAHREFLERLKQRDAKAGHVLQQLRELEANCLQDVGDIMQNYNASDSSKVSAIFSHIANLELNFY